MPTSLTIEVPIGFGRTGERSENVPRVDLLFFGLCSTRSRARQMQPVDHFEIAVEIDALQRRHPRLENLQPADRTVMTSLPRRILARGPGRADAADEDEAGIARPAASRRRVRPSRISLSRTMSQSNEIFCALITPDHRARSASMNSLIAAALRGRNTESRSFPARRGTRRRSSPGRGLRSDLRGDIVRQLGRRGDTKPDADEVVGIAALGDGRNVRKIGTPARRTHAQRPQHSGSDGGSAVLSVVEHDLDVARQTDRSAPALRLCRAHGSSRCRPSA